MEVFRKKLDEQLTTSFPLPLGRARHLKIPNLNSFEINGVIGGTVDEIFAKWETETGFDAVLLEVGSNDLCENVDVIKLANRVYDECLVQKESQVRLKFIYIFPIVARTKTGVVKQETFEDNRRTFNETLYKRSLSSGGAIRTRNHAGLSDVTRYSSDGVNPDTEYGVGKYYENVVNCVQDSIKDLKSLDKKTRI